MGPLGNKAEGVGFAMVVRTGCEDVRGGALTGTYLCRLTCLRGGTAGGAPPGAGNCQRPPRPVPRWTRQVVLHSARLQHGVVLSTTRP